MAVVFVTFGMVALVGIAAWRPHGWGPCIGAAVAVALAGLGGVVGVQDVVAAMDAQWRAFITLASVMLMTTAADRLGLFSRLAGWIEPHTRGPVRRAFRTTFILSAVVAALFSNDAAILILTPTVIALIRTVYPNRHPKFVVPFALAVFAAAGVAPLVISNPMNLVFADHAGLSFNRYALVMTPVAIASSVATYLALVWVFREPLADTAPALGAWPGRPEPLSGPARLVLGTVVAVLLAYPAVSWFEQPLWPLAAVGATICTLAALLAGQRVTDLARGVAWPIFPFLNGVFVLAVALDRIGVVAWLQSIYADSTYRIVTVGATSAVGSALLNNHPMSVLNVFALQAFPHDDSLKFAALIGGDLGPRLLPVGSLAALLWYDLLRKLDVNVSAKTFIRTGVVLTIPSMIVSLVVLRLLGFLIP